MQIARCDASLWRLRTMEIFNEDDSTLHRGPRQGLVTERPRQRYVTEGGGGTATNPFFESQPFGAYRMARTRGVATQGSLVFCDDGLLLRAHVSHNTGLLT